MALVQCTCAKCAHYSMDSIGLTIYQFSLCCPLSDGCKYVIEAFSSIGTECSLCPFIFEFDSTMLCVGFVVDGL